jgi:hypothetical protein
MPSIKITDLPLVAFSDVSDADTLLLIDAETLTSKQLTLGSFSNYSVSSLSNSIATVSANLNSNVSTLTSAINTVNANLNSNVSTLTSAINTVNANLNSNVSTLNSAINTVNANLNSNVSTLNSAINLVNSNIASVVTSVNTVNSNLVSNVSTLNSSINTVNANVSNILTGTTSFSGNKTFINNVSIGTTTPVEKLTVWQGNSYLLRTGGAKLRLADENNEVSIESVPVSSSSEMVFKTNATEKMRITGSGSVGIGTAAPSQKLDVAGNASLRNSSTATNLYVHNTYTDASNYERAVIGWTANAFQIGTEALGTGTRRSIALNYTTTIDGFARTNVPVLTLSNVGAGTGGMALGVLNIGHSQDQSRLTGFDVANKALSYAVRGSAVSGQGAHRFSGDSATGTAVGANGSIVDILAPATATNIFQARQANETVVLNVAYSGAITIANTVTSSTEAITLATLTKTQIASFPVASFRSGKLLVQAYDTVTGATQISEILVAHNGANASHTEYGIVFTGATSIVAYDVDIVSANVRLMATRATANSTQYKISETLIAS